MHICPLPCTPFEHKLAWVRIFLKNRFQIDANYLNFRVAKCVFSKSTPHPQYTRQHPSTSNAYLSTPMHTLWAKIGWVSIFLKNRFQIDAIWELPNVYFQNLLLISNTPANNLQPQMHICPLPCTPFEQKLAWVSIFLKNSFQIDAIWEWPKVYFQNLLLVSNTPDDNLQPQRHICPLPCTPFEKKLVESAYF